MVEEKMPDWYFNDQYEEEIPEDEFLQDPFDQDWMEEEAENLYPVITQE